MSVDHAALLFWVRLPSAASRPPPLSSYGNTQIIVADGGSDKVDHLVVPDLWEIYLHGTTSRPGTRLITSDFRGCGPSPWASTLRPPWERVLLIVISTPIGRRTVADAWKKERREDPRQSRSDRIPDVSGDWHQVRASGPGRQARFCSCLLFCEVGDRIS
jgi:hypothetical protein